LIQEEDSRTGGHILGFSVFHLPFDHSLTTSIPHSSPSKYANFLPHPVNLGRYRLSLVSGNSSRASASLNMVQRYAQMVDDDLLQSNHAYSPMDYLSRLKQLQPALTNVIILQN
jgi:hypothetical protein